MSPIQCRDVRYYRNNNWFIPKARNLNLSPWILLTETPWLHVALTTPPIAECLFYQLAVCIFHQTPTLPNLAVLGFFLF